MRAQVSTQVGFACTWGFIEYLSLVSGTFRSSIEYYTEHLIGSLDEHRSKHLPEEHSN